jgi:hypothetical protein
VLAVDALHMAFMIVGWLVVHEGRHPVGWLCWASYDNR